MFETSPDVVRAGQPYVVTATYGPVQAARSVSIEHLEPDDTWQSTSAPEGPNATISWYRVASNDLSTETFRVLASPEPGVPALVREFEVVHHVDLPHEVSVKAPAHSASSIELSWTTDNESLLGYDGLRIVRRQGATPPAGPDDGLVLADALHGNSYLDEQDLSPATEYSYALFPRNSDGEYGPVATVTTGTRGTAPAWGEPKSIDPRRGGSMDVSCPTPDFCGAVDAHGTGIIREAGQWREPTTAAARGLAHISCPEPGFCVASGIERVAVFDGGAWTDTALDPGHYLSSVSCPSRSFCLAIDDVNQQVAYDGSSWSKPQAALAQDSGSLLQIDCLSDTFCIGVTSMGESVMFDGDTWQDLTRFTTRDVYRVPAIDCSSPQDCVAIFESGYYSGTWTTVWDGTSWTEDPDLVNGSRPLVDLSCAGATYCVAVDHDGTTFTFDGTTWEQSASFGGLPGFSSISCPTATRCTAVGQAEMAADFDGDGWTPGTLINPEQGGLTSVSCSSPTFCVAVDLEGNALMYDGAEWGAPTRIAGSSALVKVSCGAPTNCLAINEYGQYTAFDGQKWSALRYPGWTNTDIQAQSLDCTDSTHCFALGLYDGHFYAFDRDFPYNDDGWVRRFLPYYDYSRPSGRTLSCASSSFCVVLDDRENTLVLDDGSWSVDIDYSHPAYSGDALACPASNMCLYVSTTSSPGPRTEMFDGTAWHPADEPPEPYYTDEISCASSSYCMLLADNGRTTVFDGLSWSELGATGDEFVSALSCPTEGFCMAIDGTDDGQVVQTK